VQEGRLVLPHGMSYRVLVLPGHWVLSLAALRKVHQLVLEGATVIGSRTQRIVSLEQEQLAQAQLREITRELWGSDTVSRGSRQIGKGRIAWGYTAAEWFASEGLAADCHFDAPDTAFGYIHRRWNNDDYYFISSRQKQASTAQVSFRISGRLPELWDPVTGHTRPVVAYTQDNGIITMPVLFAPYGAWFVVFRKAIPVEQQGTASTNFPEIRSVDTLQGSWQVQFDERWGGPASVEFPALSSWTERPEDGIRYYSGAAVYRKEFTVDTGHLQGEGQLYLNLGAVKDVGIASVTLNGRKLGILWAPPYRVSISGIVHAGSNVLEVEVINSWRNRLVGDRDKPAEQRFTKTNITIRPEWTLLESGLLGPVTLEAGH